MAHACRNGPRSASSASSAPASNPPKSSARLNGADGASTGEGPKSKTRRRWTSGSSASLVDRRSVKPGRGPNRTPSTICALASPPSSSSIGPTGKGFISAEYPPSVMMATTKPPSAGAHATTGGPPPLGGATAAHRTFSAIATGGEVESIVAAEPTRSFPASTSSPGATCARYPKGRSFSPYIQRRSRTFSSASSSPRVCVRNGAGGFRARPRGSRAASRRSRVWNRWISPPAQAARTVSSGQKETCARSGIGTRAKSSAGTICSRASFPESDSVTSARRAVAIAHRPAASAKHVRPYVLETATSVAYPGGGGASAATSGSENPTVPSEEKTTDPVSDSEVEASHIAGTPRDAERAKTRGANAATRGVPPAVRRARAISDRDARARGGRSQIEKEKNAALACRRAATRRGARGIVFISARLAKNSRTPSSRSPGGLVLVLRFIRDRARRHTALARSSTRAAPVHPPPPTLRAPCASAPRRSSRAS